MEVSQIPEVRCLRSRGLASTYELCPPRLSILNFGVAELRSLQRGQRSENTKSIFELANSTEVWGFIYISNLIVVLMGKQARR